MNFYKLFCSNSKLNYYIALIFSRIHVDVWLNLNIKILILNMIRIIEYFAQQKFLSYYVSF